ncbi:MAG: hypothetical protein IKM43_04025 [Clostridia bacterium]|nr:hypothetical protein [Clostridia bacterium]
MNLKKFEYMNKDIPFLKKDIKCRLAFLILFASLIVWQFVLFLLQIDSLNVIMITIGIVVMLLSFVLCVVMLMYAFKDIKILEIVKKRGSVVSSVSLLPSIKKRSFIKLYSSLSWLLAISMMLLLVSALTYSVLEFVYFNIVSFYLPLIMFVTLTAFNTVYHLKNEIKIVETIREYHDAY